jgi:site-specific DNA-cytosine methylase
VRGQLFFTLVDIKNELEARNPDLQFLFENVKMKKEWQTTINEYLGVIPTEINSSLVSAQNRKRLYWANWKIEQPEDKGLILADALEDGEVDREKSYCIDANYFKGGNPRSNFEDGKRQLVFVAGLEQGRRLDDGKSFSRNYREGYRIYSSLGKAATLSAMPKGGEGGYTGLYQVGVASDIKGIESMLRVYHPKGKAPTLSTMSGGNREPKVAMDDIHYRKLTPLECERLQTLPDFYTEGVSNTQRYKMCGNGWTIDVIAHILKSNPKLR